MASSVGATSEYAAPTELKLFGGDELQRFRTYGALKCVIAGWFKKHSDKLTMQI